MPPGKIIAGAGKNYKSSWSRSKAGLSRKIYRYRILFRAKNQSFHTGTPSVQWFSYRQVPEHSSDGLPMRDEGMSLDERGGLLKITQGQHPAIPEP